MADELDDILSIADIQQQYLGNIVLYKGVPVYVVSVSAESNISYQVLSTGKRAVAKFSLKTFTPPDMRLGMVNVDGGALYAQRIPVRKMNVGLNGANTKFLVLATNYPEGQAMTHAAVATMKHPSIAEAMLNNYPTFDECVAHTKEFGGCMAWDRQFAFDDERKVHYRSKVVGRLPKNCRKVEAIEFDKPYEYLPMLIGDNCGKALQLVGA